MRTNPEKAAELLEADSQTCTECGEHFPREEGEEHAEAWLRHMNRKHGGVSSGEWAYYRIAYSQP